MQMIERNQPLMMPWEGSYLIPVVQVFKNEYDSLGQLLSQGVNDRITEYQYDAAGRLLSQSKSAMQTTQYTYDKLGNMLTKTDAKHALWQYVYNENNQLVEMLSPEVLVSNGEKQSIATVYAYDSFGNLVQQMRDAYGIKQEQWYEYDNTNRKINTIYPKVAVNNAENTASNQRQETIKDLVETNVYNAFGELIASSDSKGNYRHFVYDTQGQLIFSINTQGAVIENRYNAFGLTTSKTSYANAVPLDALTDFSLEEIAGTIEDRKTIGMRILFIMPTIN